MFLPDNVLPKVSLLLGGTGTYLFFLGGIVGGISPAITLPPRFVEVTPPPPTSLRIPSSIFT